jgi:hypothetical protein
MSIKNKMREVRVVAIVDITIEEVIDVLKNKEIILTMMIHK